MKILRKVGKVDAAVQEKSFGKTAKLRFVNGKPGIILSIDLTSGGTSTPMQARQKVAMMKEAIRDMEAAIAEAEKA
jgi:hypothetical protein